MDMTPERCPYPTCERIETVKSSVIARMDAFDIRMDERHEALRQRLDKIDGSVGSHAEFIIANRERLLAQYAAVKRLQELVGNHELAFAEQRGGVKTAVILASAIGGLVAMVGGVLMAHFLKAVLP